MTLDLNALAVESFATVAGDPSQWGLAGPESTGCNTYAFSCVQADNGTVADTYVSCAGVAALTEAYPCKTTR